MRGVGDIMEDLMDVWSSIDTTQKAAVAQTLAGKYQMTRFMALMNRSDLYDEYKFSSENASGTLDTMNEKYVDSLEGRLTKLQATFEGLLNSFGDSSELYGFIDALTSALDVMNDLVDSIGGGSAALTSLGAIATKVFSKQIAGGISNLMQNLAVDKLNNQNQLAIPRLLEEAGQSLDSYGNDKYKGYVKEGTLSVLQSRAEYADKGLLNDKDAQAYSEAIENTVHAVNQLIAAETNVQEMVDKTNTAMQNATGITEEFLKVNEQGQIEKTQAYQDNIAAIFPNDADLHTEFLQVINDDFADTYEHINTFQSSFASMSDRLAQGNNVTRESTKTLRKEMLSLFNSMTGEGAKSFKDINKLADMTVEEGEESNQVLKDLAQSFSEVWSAMGKGESSLKPETEQAEKFTQALNNLEDELEKIKTLALASQDIDLPTDADIDAANKRQSNAKATYQGQLNSNKGQDARMDDKERWQNIVQITSAVIDLAFAWQSFQSLGSIWANVDLSTGEKIEQTILNLVFVLPQLISAIKTLKESKLAASAIESLASGLSEMFLTTASGVTTTLGLTSATESLAAAQTSAAAGATKLAAALGPIAIGATALIAIGTAIKGYFDQQNEERIEAVSQAAEEATSSISSLKDSVSSFEELYAKYKDGTATSDEMSSAAETLNSVLDDQALKTATAAKNWEAYASSLDAAAKKKLQSDIGDVWSQRDENAKAGTEGFNRGFLGLGGVATGTHPDSMNAFYDAYGSEFSGLGISGAGQVYVDSSLNDEEAYAQLSALVDEYQQHSEEFFGELDASEKRIIDTVVSNAKSQLNNENYAKVREADETLGSAYAQLYQSDSDLAYTKGTSVKDYKSQVKQELAEKTGKEVSDTLVESFVNGMTETDTNLATQQAKESAAESAKTAREMYLANAQNGSDEDFINNVLDQFNDDEIVKISASFDYDDLIKNANEIIDRLNSGEDLDDIIASIKVKNDGVTQEEIDDSIFSSDNFTADDGRAEQLGMSAENVEEYTEALLESNTAQGKNLSQIQDSISARKKEEREIESQINQLERKTDRTDEEEEALSNLKNSLEETQDEESAETKQLNRLTNKAIESQKAVDELSDSFDSNAKVLRSSDSSLQEVTDTVNDMVPGIQGLLNIDMSGWTQDVKNAFVTENLDDIEAALNGDEEALMRLRNAAAERIAVEIGISDNEDLAAEASDLVSYANSILPFIEAGASIDDEQFNNQLEAMINNALKAGISIDDIMNYLSGMGIDAEVETVQQTFKGTMTSPALTVESGNGITHYSKSGEVIQQDYSGNLAVPQVRLKKDSNGNALVRKSNTSASSGGRSGRTGGSSGSGSGGSGGSGSGSGSSYTPQTKDPIEDEIDRYERVNTQLDAISAEYEKLKSEQDRLTGDALAKNLEKQNKLLNRQIALYQEKLKIQQEEAAELQSQLASEYGITFDEEGFIQNYAQVHQGLVDNVNNLISQYNAATTEAAQESLEKQIEAAEDRLDKFKDKYSRYDDLISNDIKDVTQSIEDLKDSIEDLQIEAFQKQVDALDNIKEIQEATIEFNRAFNRGVISSPFDEAADSIAKLGKYFDVTTGSMTEYYDTLIAKQQEVLNSSDSTDAQKKYAAAQIENLSAARTQALNGDMSVNSYGTGYLDMSMRNVEDIMSQINQYNETGTSSIFGENSAELYEVAKDVFDQATGLISDYWDEIENLHDKIMDGIDEIGDAMDRRKEQYEAITDELEHQANIVEMLRGDESYDELNKILAAQQTNYQSELDTLIQQRDVWQDMLDSLGERNKNNSEEWDEISNKIKDATSEINGLIETSLENLQQQYTNTVNKITNAWSTDIFGTDLDWINTQWELINRNADYYLDDTNKAYNIQKLQSKYLDLLDGTNDLSIQRKITSQMAEQLDYLREKTNLSEYDVQYANAQLEILQKQIALEEAQRNKSQMKLRRDTQGNYSYVYTADQDDVRSAESDLLDAQNNAYNLSKDQMKQTQADSLSALQDAQSTINDIWNNANLTLEEKKARTQTIIDSLKEYLAGTSEQLSTSETNIINDFIGMCEMLTDENKSGLMDVYNQIIDGNKDAFDQIDTRWQTSLTQWLTNLDEFNVDTDTMFNNLIEAGETYQKQTDELAETAKTNFNDISDSIDNAVSKTSELSSSTAEFIQQLKDMSGAVQSNEETMQKYVAQIQSAENAMKAYKEQVDDLSTRLTKKEQENANLSRQLQEATDKYNAEVAKNSGSSGSSGSGSSGGNSDPTTAKRIANSIWQYGDWGNGITRKNRITARFGSSMYDLVQSYFNGSPAYGYQYKDYSIGFERYDSGGYTGEWSDGDKNVGNGKLAFLHQKELILNATDTENILSAVNAIRSITDGLKSNSLASLISALNTQSISSMSTGQDIEQNVHITAEFPNANSASEIESALMSLNERAVQYAFKTR